jgi:hypothetical protein
LHAADQPTKPVAPVGGMEHGRKRHRAERKGSVQFSIARSHPARRAKRNESSTRFISKLINPSLSKQGKPENNFLFWGRRSRRWRFSGRRLRRQWQPLLAFTGERESILSLSIARGIPNTLAAWGRGGFQPRRQATWQRDRKRRWWLRGVGG